MRADASKTLRKAAAGTGVPPSSPSFLSSLHSPLQQYALAALDDIVESDSRRIDEFEISTRSHLLTLTNSLLLASNDEEEEEEAMEDLLLYLRSVLDLCVHILTKDDSSKVYQDMISTNSSALCKLPFLLLEDTIDTLPLSTLQPIWIHGPFTWILQENVLCQPLLFTPMGSKYAFIRMCNKLLKSLRGGSVVVEFGGQIMMLLAHVFPLSERSAVNALGTFHLSNITLFETLEEWKGNRPTTAGSTMEQERTILDYEFYATFWGVQESFMDPVTLLPKDGGEKEGKSKSNLDAFCDKMQTILSALEGHGFKDETVRQSNARWLANKQRLIPDYVDGGFAIESDSMDIDSPGTALTSLRHSPFLNSSSTRNTTVSASSSIRHHRYLTNSQLLHLQMRDPEIRIHFLTQFFIISNYLSSAISTIITTLQQPSTKADNIPLVKACSTSLLSLAKLENRSEELMRQTPPNGAAHLQTLRWLLSERESSWREWKKAKCLPPIEKVMPHVTNPPSIGRQDDNSKKDHLNGNDDELKESMKLYSCNVNLQTTLPTISFNMSKATPSLPSYLEEYMEALDPEAGIEAEYHPKNDKLYAWRAMRLLSRNYVGRFELVQRSNGDFERLVRVLAKEEWGVHIPGDMPPEDDRCLDDVVCDGSSGDVAAIDEKDDAHRSDDDENNSAEEEEGEYIEEENEEVGEKNVVIVPPNQEMNEDHHDNDEQESATTAPLDENDLEGDTGVLDDVSVGDAASVGSPTDVESQQEQEDNDVKDEVNEQKHTPGKRPMTEFEKAAIEEEEEMLQAVETTKHDLQQSESASETHMRKRKPEEMEATDESPAKKTFAAKGESKNETSTEVRQSENFDKKEDMTNIDFASKRVDDNLSLLNRESTASDQPKTLVKNESPISESKMNAIKHEDSKGGGGSSSISGNTNVHHKGRSKLSQEIGGRGGSIDRTIALPGRGGGDIGILHHDHSRAPPPPPPPPPVNWGGVSRGGRLPDNRDVPSQRREMMRPSEEAPNSGIPPPGSEGVADGREYGNRRGGFDNRRGSDRAMSELGGRRGVDSRGGGATRGRRRGSSWARR